VISKPSTQETPIRYRLLRGIDPGLFTDADLKMQAHGARGVFRTEAGSVEDQSVVGFAGIASARRDSSWPCQDSRC
jgi:hypothetical protein